MKGIRPVGDYRVRVVFRDGYIGEANLAALFAHPRGPMTEPFKDPEFFQKVFVEGGAATWPNEYDICPDVLRYYCEIGRACSREELAAAFNTDNNLNPQLNERHSPQ